MGSENVMLILRRRLTKSSEYPLAEASRSAEIQVSIGSNGS
jgi:hypothetical protein